MILDERMTLASRKLAKAGRELEQTRAIATQALRAVKRSRELLKARVYPY